MVTGNRTLLSDTAGAHPPGLVRVACRSAMRHNTVVSELDASEGHGGASAGVVLTNEFASVRVSVDRASNGVRLLVEDLESGATVYLDPLQLTSFCHASDADRIAWLHVGNYRDNRP